MLESQVEKPAVRYAQKHGIKIKKKIRGEHLDRTFYFNYGRTWIVEFKAPKKKLTDLQYEEINELLALGHDIEVHDNVEEFKKSLHLRYDLQQSGLGFRNVKVVSTPIPERFYPVAARARSGRPVRRSGYRQNFNNFGRS